MHPVIHVAISLIIGLVFLIHSRLRYSIIISCAILVNVIIDSDIFLLKAGLVEHRVFSTGFAMIYIPLILLLGIHLYERKTDRSILTRITLLVILISSSHLIMDTFYPYEVVYLWYPFNTTEYVLDQSLLPLAVIGFACLVIVFKYIESTIYRMNEGGGLVRRKRKIKYGPSRIDPFLSEITSRLDDLDDE
ncbi:MAG: hypothetical protein R6U61_03820 [Thermoplasmata archaeon]